jgi:hypothetical protein
MLRSVLPADEVPAIASQNEMATGALPAASPLRLAASAQNGARAACGAGCWQPSSHVLWFGPDVSLSPVLSPVRVITENE